MACRCAAGLLLGVLVVLAAVPACGGAGAWPHSAALPVARTIDLRGGGATADADDSGARREAAMLAEMGLEPVGEGDERGLFDLDGRRLAPAAPTIPGELCSDDDLSNPSEPACSSENDGRQARRGPTDQTDPEYMTAEKNGSDSTALRATVRVKYYDLANGATHNISAAFPDQVPISGMWQLAIRVHGREFTFCAHRGVITYDPRLSPFGRSMCVRRAGSTTLRDDEVVQSLRTLHHRFNPVTFDAWECTSINFCEQFAYILTGDEAGIPRSITVPILLEASSDEGLATWGDLARHARKVNVTHLPAQLDRQAGEVLGSIFKKWGQRPPNRMRLGPNGEHIGPFLPTAETDYWEPPPGHLAVGMPIADALLETRDEFEKARRARMRGYLRQLDQALVCSVGEAGGNEGGREFRGLRGGGGEGRLGAARAQYRGRRLRLRGGEQRPLKTQVGIVRRLLREFEVAGKDAKQQRQALEAMKESGESDAQPARVLGEAEASIVDSRRRLEEAIAQLLCELEVLLASGQHAAVQGEEAAPNALDLDTISEDLVSDIKAVADAIFMLSSRSVEASVQDAEQRLDMAVDDMRALLDSCHRLCDQHPDS